MRRLFPLLVAALMLSGCATAGATTLNATPSTLPAQIAAAQDGDTVLLAAGSYGTWAGTTKAITVRPQDGAVASIGLTWANVANYTIDGLRVTGIDTPSGGWTARNVTVRNSTFTGQAVFRSCGGTTVTGVILERNRHVGINAGQYEGRIHLPGNAAGTCGITIRDSFFSGGCSDGIQNGANGVQILGNEFTGLVQGSCGPHVDSIQTWGGSGRIDGNYVHDNSTGIIAYDSGNHDLTISNNVIANIGQSVNSLTQAGGRNDRIVHNTVINGDITFGGANDTTPETGLVLKDNVVRGGSIRCPDTKWTLAAYSHNLTSDASCAGGTSNLSASAVFAGPTSYAGYALAAGSPGKGNASDGTDRGITTTGPVPPPPPPPPVDTDKDGVPDSQDACPTVVGSQADGCPPPPPPPPADSCAQTKAERDRALTDLASMTVRAHTAETAVTDTTALLEQVRGQREAYRTRLEAALAKIAAALAALN